MDTIPIIKDLNFKNHPIHVFQYRDKIAFLALQVADVLGIKQPAKSIRSSKTLEEGIDYAIVSAKTLGARDKFDFAYGLHTDKVAILFLSGFFLFVLRSTKELAAPFSRWVIREAIQIAWAQQQQKKLSDSALMSMIAEERKGSRFAHQVLINHGFQPAPKALPEPKPGGSQ